jgi:opacity protein-like surface antigen
MRKVVLAAVAGLSMTSAAFPADMTLSPTLAQNQEEIGSGWYIRGDIGEALITNPGVNSVSIAAPPAGNAGTSIVPVYSGSVNTNVFAFGAGFGYQFTPWFRMDATFDHFNSVNTGYGGTVVCPYTATGLYSNTNSVNPPPNTPLGIFYNPNDTCDGVEKISNSNNVALVNAYVDIPMWGGFAPYVGAGAGLNFMQTTGALTYNKTSDGTTYAANLTAPSGFPPVWIDVNGNALNPQPKISFTPQNWNRSLSQTKVTMAIALMAGVTYHVNDWVALDLGYRYVNADVGNFGSNYSNEFRAGIRIYAN